MPQISSFLIFLHIQKVHYPGIGTKDLITIMFLKGSCFFFNWSDGRQQIWKRISASLYYSKASIWRLVGYSLGRNLSTSKYELVFFTEAFSLTAVSAITFLKYLNDLYVRQLHWSGFAPHHQPLKLGWNGINWNDLYAPRNI